MEATIQKFYVEEPPPRRLLTAEAGAKFLGLGRTTFLGLVYSGEIPSITIGRSRRVDVEDLNAFIARQKAAQGV